MFIPVWAATVISPLELIRTKMQSEKLTYRQVHTAIKDMLRQEGFLSLWKGLGPSLLRDVPFSGKYNEPRREDIGLGGFQPGLTLTYLYNHRNRLEA